MLAIIIPYYKINFFKETLESLANQTDKRFKVYIGNDASTEDPTDLLNEFKGQIDFEYVAFTNNLGSKSLAKQWERCIALSKNEEWLMILGDDDVLDKNAVAAFYKNIKTVSAKSINVIRFASRIIDDSGNYLSEIYTHPKIEDSTTAYYQKFILESRSSLSEYIFNKERFKKYGFVNYPLGWHSDDKAWLDFTGGGDIYTINETVIYIRRSGLSISGKNDNLVLKNKARRLFLKDIILDKNFKFNKQQKKDLLFEYGVLIVEQNLIKFANVRLVLRQFIIMGLFYDAARFIRRIYIAKFTAKR